MDEQICNIPAAEAKAAPPADFVFEVSSEVARKVGGIYTVIRSKTESMIENFDGNYCAIGVYDAHSAAEEFEEIAPDEQKKACFKELEGMGIKCHYGKWVLGNNAKTILVDAWEFGNRKIDADGHGEDKQINVIKSKLWKEYGVDSLFETWDFNENVIWSYACGKVIERLVECEKLKGKRVVAQFHEWISAAGLLYLKSKKIDVATVFTTHATTLGRAKVSNNEELMTEIMDNIARGITINVQEAYRFKIEGRYLLEKAAAKNADVFTAVSETVAEEAAYILGRAPDKITPNALDFSGYPPIKEIQKRHSVCREEIKKLFKAAFLPYYNIRTGNARIAYIAARYEFENKGIDLFLEALAEVNRRLKKKNSRNNLYALVLVPSNSTEPHLSLQRNLLEINRIKTILFEELQNNTGIIEFIENTRNQKKAPGLYNEITRLIKNMKKIEGNPPLACFRLNYDNDRIVNKMRELGLENSEEDRVKVLFYPAYLKPGDGLLNMEYEDVINGTDIGVFPSRYEPWGYTPVEAGAMLAMAVTTDRAGFGKFIMKKFQDTSKRGIRVVDMERTRNPAAEIADILEETAEMEESKMDKLKRDARCMVETCRWEEQINNYLEAYKLALEKKKVRA